MMKTISGYAWITLLDIVIVIALSLSLIVNQYKIGGVKQMAALAILNSDLSYMTLDAFDKFVLYYMLL